MPPVGAPVKVPVPQLPEQIVNINTVSSEPVKEIGDGVKDVASVAPQQPVEKIEINLAKEQEPTVVQPNELNQPHRSIWRRLLSGGALSISLLVRIPFRFTVNVLVLAGLTVAAPFSAYARSRWRGKLYETFIGASLRYLRECWTAFTR